MLPEGIVERWFIADGAIVAAGDPMAEIRIEDALHEIMAPVSGRLTIVAAANTVDVLARVITLSWAASWSFFQADPATADSDSSMRVKAGP